MNRSLQNRATRHLPILSTALLAAIGLGWDGAGSGAAAQSSDPVVVDYGALDSVGGAAPAAQPAGTPTSVLTKLGLDKQPVSSIQPTAPGATSPGMAALTPPPEPVAIPNSVPMPEATPNAPPPAAVAAPAAPPAAAVETPAPAPAAAPAAAATEPLTPDEQAAVEPIEQQPPAQPPVQAQYGEQPVQEQAAVAQPAEQQPVEQQPAEQQPVQQQPAEEQAAIQQPAAEQPAQEQPVEEQPPEQPAEAEAPAEQQEAPAAAAPAAEPPAAEATPEETTEEEPAEEAAAEEPEQPDNNRQAAPIPEGGIRIVFPTELNEVPAEANAALDDLANQMLADESMRISIMCYSSGDQETLDKARRKSLQRCLNVRQYLFQKNIRTTRIDVRALGPKSEGQPADRVDIIPANS